MQVKSNRCGTFACRRGPHEDPRDAVEGNLRVDVSRASHLLGGPAVLYSLPPTYLSFGSRSACPRYRFRGFGLIMWGFQLRKLPNNRRRSELRLSTDLSIPGLV